jgi:hypothetical protein
MLQDRIKPMLDMDQCESAVVIKVTSIEWDSEENQPR